LTLRNKDDEKQLKGIYKRVLGEDQEEVFDRLQSADSDALLDLGFLTGCTHKLKRGSSLYSTMKVDEENNLDTTQLLEHFILIPQIRVFIETYISSKNPLVAGNMLGALDALTSQVTISFSSAEMLNEIPPVGISPTNPEVMLGAGRDIIL